MFSTLQPIISLELSTLWLMVFIAFNVTEHNCPEAANTVTGARNFPGAITFAMIFLAFITATRNFHGVVNTVADDSSRLPHYSPPPPWRYQHRGSDDVFAFIFTVRHIPGAVSTVVDDISRVHHCRPPSPWNCQNSGG